MTPTKIGNPTEPLQKLSIIVDALHATFQELQEILKDQMDAVISSDIETVDELTEKYTTVQVRYKSLEKKFVNELASCIQEESGENAPLGIESLESSYPEDSEWINKIRSELKQQAGLLKHKHSQLVDLLEFALVRNAGLMHAIYSLHCGNNTRYNPGGTKNEVAAGVAVNHRV